MQDHLSQIFKKTKSFLNRFYFINNKQPLSFDSKFAHGVEEVFPLLFLCAQTLFMLVELAAHCPGLLGSQIQGLVLLALKQQCWGQESWSCSLLNGSSDTELV